MSFCLIATIFGQTNKNSIEILFVGNSLTYTNNLPKLVQKQASKQGIPIRTKMMAEPNYAIVDHLDYGNLQEVIQTGQFDYVIVQQGPSSQEEGRQLLIEGGRRLKPICEAKETTLCYFMVWPSRQYYFTFDDLIENHQEAADLNEAVLIPVGNDWKLHIQNTNQWDLYGADGFHPSKKGSEMAARIILKTLFPTAKTK